MTLGQITAQQTSVDMPVAMLNSKETKISTQFFISVTGI